MEPFFLGQIVLFGGNFAPRNWATCQGQLLSISSDTALFSILGTIYGGDGRTTFALPDFRGRIPIGAGQGPGLSDFRQGSMGGRGDIYINASQLPSHQHQTMAEVGVTSKFGKTNNPSGATLSRSSEALYALASEESGKFTGTSATVQPQGGGQAISNHMPSLGINFIIALQGSYPSRS